MDYNVHVQQFCVTQKTWNKPGYIHQMCKLNGILTPDRWYLLKLFSNQIKSKSTKM